jgi:hypothetical protein
VKPAILKWECIPDPASPYKVTLRNACALPQQTLLPRRPWTTSSQPCSSHFRSRLVYAWWKLEESPISPLRVSLFHVFFFLILVSSLPGDPRLWTVTHVSALPEQGVLLTKLRFSILIIPVQAQLLGHAPTTISPTQCALMLVSISVLTPSIALRNNG